MIKRKEFLPTRKSKIRCLMLIFFVVFIYILDNSSITSFIDSFTFSYIIKPILWIGIAFVVWTFPSIKAKGQLKLQNMLKLWAFNFAIIYIIVTVLAGLIDALGKSPYNHSLKGILTNIIFVGSALLSRELIRSYLVNSFTDKENYLVFVLIALLLTLSNIPFSRYMKLTSVRSAVELIAQFIAPEFSQNLLATYLVFLGGPLISIIYYGIIEGFHWLSPVLPSLKWITTALIGILCPIFFMLSLQTMYLNETKKIKRREQEEEPLGWLVTSGVSIILIWFAVGVFPIYPSVIATGSMEPIIKPGDVILVKKIVNMDGINSLKVGDVIQFKRDSILISHRIKDIVNDEKEGIRFETEGDSNSGPDTELVKPQDIKGIIVYNIPKIGWPTLLIKSNRDIPLEEIVF